jgi:Transposase DNA-binding/Transposase DDE domain
MDQILEARTWARETFGQCELGDARRTSRLVALAEALALHSGSSMSRACEGDEASKEGAYRFMRNRHIAPEVILAGGFKSTVERARGLGLLLALEDTTSLSFKHETVKGIRGVCAGEVHAHSVLLVEAARRRTVGLIEQTLWCREGVGKRGQRKQRRYEDKESKKWQRASERVRELLGEERMREVISVCDRESDVYEYLLHKTREGERYVVRAAQDRGVEGELERLFAQVKAGEEWGERTLEIGQRGGRSKRTAQLKIRAVSVELKAPRSRPGLGPIKLNAVLAEEEEEKGLRWLLLTSEPIGSRAEVARVLEYYARRWGIEEFHQAWKSGAGVERMRSQRVENLLRGAVVLGFIAVRLLQIREVVSEDAGEVARACDEVLGELEWQVLWVTTAKKAPPKVVPSLGWAYRALAKLGGFLDTKRTGRAGWATLWEGWRVLNEHLAGARALLELAKYERIKM